jgi:hypothetical protein
MAEENLNMFSLKLTGEGINVDRQIDHRAALQVLQVVMAGGDPIATTLPSSNVKSDPRSSNEAALSLREYLDKVGATKKPDQIATIAHYISQHEGQGDFGRDDIRLRFSSAREPLPGNFARDFGAALKAGWIAEVHGNKNRFYVTAKGTQAINSGFAGEKVASKRRKSVGRIGAARSEKGGTSPKRSSGNSIGPRLEAWIEEGFFETPRTLRAVHGRLHEHGVIAPQTAISGPLLKAVQQGRMTRRKIAEDGKDVWAYCVGGA